MSPERWQEIEKVYDGALACEPGQRRAFLDQSCAGDTELRSQVDWMLAHQNEAGRFMRVPAVEAAAQLLTIDPEGSLTGVTLGPYHGLSLIGVGGMGEVYTARNRCAFPSPFLDV